MTHTDNYDAYFKAAAISHFSDTGIDWNWFKAQGIAESALNPLAMSPCGARGIMQIMPATWDEIKQWLEIDEPYDAKDSIMAGVFYMRRMWDFWWGRGIQNDCLKFAQASYNAGLGNIKKAWRKTRNADSWKEIAEQLPAITGKHATETIDYVAKIEKIHKELTA